jgi:hypothetical protein
VSPGVAALLALLDSAQGSALDAPELAQQAWLPLSPSLSLIFF